MRLKFVGAALCSLVCTMAIVPEAPRRGEIVTGVRIGYSSAASRCLSAVETATASVSAGARDASGQSGSLRAAMTLRCGVCRSCIPTAIQMSSTCSASSAAAQRPILSICRVETAQSSASI